MEKLFICKTATPDGTVTETLIKAEDVFSLEKDFEKKGVAVLHIREKNSLLSLIDSANHFKQNVKSDDLVLFCKELSILIRGGMSLAACLAMLSEHTSNGKLRQALKHIKSEVEGGLSLSEAMAKHEDIFSKFFTASIKSGENTDNLTEVLLKLAEYNEIISKLKKKTMAALIYPLFLVTLAIFATMYLIIFVVPIFAKLYLEIGQQLPALTRAIISLSNFLRTYYYILIAGFIALYLVYSAYKSKFKGFFDRLQMKIPFVRDILIKYVLANTCRTISMLIKSGVPLTKALEISSEIIENSVISAKFKEAGRGLFAGETFANSLKMTGLIPPLTIEMVHTGEQTGALDEMLENASLIYQEEVNSKISSLLVIIEPVMMLILGLFIALVLLSMYLPIFELSAKF